MHRIKLNILRVLLAIFLFLCVLPVRGQTVSLEETDLTPGDSPAGIYLGLDEDLFIVDQTRLLWKINPETGDYFYYDGVGGDELMDISFESSTLLWWADATTTFGSFDLSSNTLLSWQVNDFNPEEEPLQLGPVAYGLGKVWLASYFGPQFGIFSFFSGAESNQLCLYKLPSGLDAADIIFYDDLLWAIDWGSDTLFSIDSDGNLLTYPTASSGNIRADANLVSDGTNLWWPAYYDNAIVRYNSADGEIAKFNLPISQQPRNINLQTINSELFVWYTSGNNSFGRLDPNNAEDVTIIPSIIPAPTAIDPECIDIGDANQEQLSPENDRFLWNGIEEEMTELDTGIVNFSLPDGAEPFGITNASGYIWVTDLEWDKLIRMPIESEPEQAYIIVDKVVINNDGGLAQPDDFLLTLDGDPVTRGMAVPVEPGTHIAGENLLEGYTRIGFSGDCNSSGEVTVAQGETKTCTLTNDDVGEGDDFQVYIPLILR